MEQINATLESITQPKIDTRTLTPPTPAAERLANLLVILTVAVALLLGWLLMAGVQGRTALYSDSFVRFEYPATWVVDQDEDGNAMVRDPRSASQRFNNRIIVIHGDLPKSGLPGSSPLADAATSWTLKRSSTLNTFRNLASEDGWTIAGQPAIRVDYAYVADPAAALGRPGMPVVVRGADLVLITGDRLTVIAGQGAADNWASFEPQFLRLVDGVAAASGSAATEGGS